MTPAQRRLVEENLDLVSLVVGKYLRRNAVLRHLEEDLKQEGVFGLMYAAKRYDPSRSPHFRSFAVMDIKRRMHIAARKDAAQGMTQMPEEEWPNLETYAVQPWDRVAESHEQAVVVADLADRFTRRLEEVAEKLPRNGRRNVELFALNLLCDTEGDRSGSDYSVRALGREYGMTFQNAALTVNKVWQALEPWMKAVRREAA
jgi:RNA polymerase sigma factor (sigma-70 family)